MEREGSGFDRMYEQLLASGRPGPTVIAGDDRVTVIVARRVAHPEVIDLIDKADRAYQLRHRERITLGLIAQHESLTAIQLCKALALKNAEALQPWIGRLGELELVLAQGRTKGTTYKINPDVLRAQNFRGRTSLKGIERQLRSELLAMVKDGVLLPIGEGGGRCVHGIPDSACIHTADCRIIVF